MIKGALAYIMAIECALRSKGTGSLQRSPIKAQYVRNAQGTIADIEYTKFPHAISYRTCFRIEIDVNDK